MPDLAGQAADIDEVRDGLERTRHLRMALDLLEETLPGSYASDGLLTELWALREKFAAVELAQLRRIGQREYLVVKPMDPAAPGPLAVRAAKAIEALDSLGLVIRLA